VPKNAASGSIRVGTFSTSSQCDLASRVVPAAGPPAQAAPKPKSKVTLTEPVIVSRFWRNRRGEAVVVSLREYDGRALIDLRVNFTNNEGKLQPTAKGLALIVQRLPDLATAVNNALAKAKELGLIREPLR
jgi:hypothetical protein